MKRLIIVNWRWSKYFKDINDSKDRYNSFFREKDLKELVISKMAKHEDFNGLIEKLLKVLKKSDECIIFSHYAEKKSIGNISISKKYIKKPEEFKGILKIYEFSGGEDKIYFGTTNPSGLFNPNDETIKTENFDYIWDYYWNQRELDDQKKKIINTFLPLILDIKGLNELPNDSKRRKEYLNEIHQAIGKQKPESINNKGKNTSATENDDTLSGYGIDLIFGWNEIKKVLSEKYRITDKASLYFSPLESEEKPGFTIDNIKHLFDDSKKDDRNKAIQWFEDIQKLLNEKVKPERESGTSKS